MRIFRGVHPIGHYPFVPVEGDPDEHGNLPGDLAEDPTPRKVIAFYSDAQTQTREPVTAEYVARYLSRLVMLVEDPTVFGPQDEVEIGSTRYEIDGDPVEGDWRHGPFPMVNRLFGGEVHLRRVG